MKKRGERLARLRAPPPNEEPQVPPLRSPEFLFNFVVLASLMRFSLRENRIRGFTNGTSSRSSKLLQQRILVAAWVAVPASNGLHMNHFPVRWANSADAAALWQRLRSAPRCALMLDYDGTLAPFHADRFEALPYPGVEERLAVLSGLSRVRLVLVTGRSARELAGLLRLGNVEIWGSHGRERISRDGHYELFALASVEQAALEQVGKEITDLGFMGALEVKPSSLAIHWRSLDAATQEQLRTLTLSSFAHLKDPGSLHLLPFDGGLELRSNDRTKGNAVKQIEKEEPAGSPVAYLGDDLTDEDAFAALGKHGVSILVRNELRESAARFWLRPPAELINFLDEWMEATRGALVSGEVRP
jgi:trehalose-phosphatase